jgi:hypothetical protein
MNEKQGLWSSGLGMVARNKRYLVWFWLLNLTLAELGTASFRISAHAILDHSFAARRLLHGFDLGTLGELLARPEFGQLRAMSTPAFDFAFLFFLATAVFLPGVFLGYASPVRLPRDDFFCVCGRNLWRFLRLLLTSGIILSVVVGALFAVEAALRRKSAESTKELLPFETRLVCLGLIFLVMTTLRIWFDLAEVDTVLGDQPAVRRSLSAGLRHTLRSLPSLLGGYLVAAIFAGLVFVAGLWVWGKLVAPASLLGAFVVGQIILFLSLIPRFWQRGIAVSYWQQKMAPRPATVVRAVPPEPFFPPPVETVAPESTPLPPPVPPETQEP